MTTQTAIDKKSLDDFNQELFSYLIKQIELSIEHLKSENNSSELNEFLLLEGERLIQKAKKIENYRNGRYQIYVNNMLTSIHHIFKYPSLYENIIANVKKSHEDINQIDRSRRTIMGAGITLSSLLFAGAIIALSIWLGALSSSLGVSVFLAVAAITALIAFAILSEKLNIIYANKLKNEAHSFIKDCSIFSKNANKLWQKQSHTVVSSDNTSSNKVQIKAELRP